MALLTRGCFCLAGFAVVAGGQLFGVLASENETGSGLKLSGERLSELLQLDLGEVKTRMVQIFDYIDTDKDGIITKEEATTWTGILKEAMHKHQVELEFSQIDMDSNAQITLEELQKAYSEGMDPQNEEATKENVKKRFDAVDKDKSGNLSLDEVNLLMDPSKDTEIMNIEVAEILQSQDKDGDRKISVDEFLSTEGGTMSPQESDELRREFSNYDLNRDGFIDGKELEDIIRDPHAQELKTMMEQLTEDMDEGKHISKQTWEDKYETFAVSMLTNNGELLRFPTDYKGLNMPFKDIKTKVDPDATGDKDEL